MNRPLDSLDEKILSELTADARIPIAALAKKVNLSRNAVRVRIERLEREQNIVQYTIVQGGTKKNRQDVFIALVLINRHDRMRGAVVLDALRAIPEITECHVLSGQFDLMVQVKSASAEQLQKVCQRIWQIDGIADTETRFVLATPIKPR